MDSSTYIILSNIIWGEQTELNTIDRINVFMKEAMETSTYEKASENLRYTELAFVLDTNNVDVLKIKKRLVKKIPVLALWSVYNNMVLTDSIGLEDFPIYTDKRIRELTLELSSDRLIFAANLANIDIKIECRDMWKLFMETIVLDHNTLLPDNVSEGIFEWVIKNRCKQEVKHFRGVNKKILLEIFSDVSLDNTQILNKKQDLCSAIADINVIIKMNTNRRISECYNKVSSLTDNQVDKTLSSELKKNLLLMDDITSKWYDINTYKSNELCNEKLPCDTYVQRLHSIAKAVETTSNSCNKEIKKLLKKRLVQKRSNGEQLSIFEKFKSYI